MLNQLSAILPGEAEKDFSASNWKYRRVVIFGSLALIGFVLLLFALTVALAIIMQARNEKAINFDRGIIELAGSMSWALSTAAMSIIMAYVFGANWDTNNFRKSVLELSNKSVVTTEIKRETTVTDPNSPAAVTKTETTQASTGPVAAVVLNTQADPAATTVTTNPTGGAPTTPPKPPYDAAG